MNLYYSDENGYLTDGIRELMEKAALKAAELEFGAELRAAGIDPADTDAEIGKVNFCGRERTVINIKAKTQDKDVYEKQLSMINGSYVIVITFRAFDEKDLDAAVKAFSILK